MFPVAKAVIHLGSTEIINTFAEAFRLRFARLLVTAHDTSWLEAVSYTHLTLPTILLV